MTTNQKGAIAETAITHEAVRLGIGVSRPVLDLRYDLIFDVGKRLLRVQCKWASRYDDVVLLRLFAARRARSGLLRSFYDAEQIDAFAAHCADLGTCYFVEIAEAADHRQLMLRLGPTRNNQASGIRWARDYEFAARLGRVLGP